MRTILVQETVTTTGAYTKYSNSIDLSKSNGIAGDCLSVQAAVTVDTPSAVVFAPSAVNATTDIVTSTAHGLTSGLKGRLTTVTTLPGGLSLATDYFIIVVTADTFKFATTLVNAIAGTAVNITDAGTGNHTFTPTSIEGGTAGLEQSNDNVTFFALGSTQAVTVTASFVFEKDRPTMRYVRAAFVITAGNISTSSIFFVTGSL